MGSQRFSFKSPDRTRQGGTLTRESSLRGGAPAARPRPSETPSLELGDEDSQSLRSDADGSLAEAQQPGSGGHTGTTGAGTEELKAEEDQNGGGAEDKSVKDAEAEAEADPASQNHQEDKGGEGDTTARSESSSELNHSFDSESLDLQLSDVANGTLYIEEKEDPPSIAVDPLASKEVPQKVSGLSLDRAGSDTYWPQCPLLFMF